MSSANPADPQTRQRFKSMCTSVQSEIESFYRHGSVTSQDFDQILKELGDVVAVLKEEINGNREYWVDGPLVRMLTAKMEKALMLTQDVKRICLTFTPQNSSYDWYADKIFDELRAVLQDLDPYFKNAVYSQVENGNEKPDFQGLSSSSWAPAKASNARQGQEGETTQETVNPDAISSSDRAPGDVLKWKNSRSLEEKRQQPLPNILRYQYPMPHPKRIEEPSPNPAKVMLKEPVRSHYSHPDQPHSDSWPEDIQYPPNLFERTQPPFVDPHVRTLPLYRNMPQFTGINLPIPKLPSAELGYKTEHSKHWDGKNNTYIY